MTSRTVGGIKVADEVWIATALLHRKHPGRPATQLPPASTLPDPQLWLSLLRQHSIPIASPTRFSPTKSSRPLAELRLSHSCYTSVASLRKDSYSLAAHS